MQLGKNNHKSALFDYVCSVFNSRRRALSILLLFCAVTSSVQTATAQASLAEMTPGAVEVAKDLGIVSILEQLLVLKAHARDDKPMSPQMLTDRQEMTERILMAFLELRSVIAELDDQISQNGELLDYLEQRRDRAIRLNNITNFVSNGALTMIGSSMQIGTPFSVQNAGNEIGVAAGALTTGISTYALKQSRGERKSERDNQNMLTQVFDLPDPQAISKYPDTVRVYLNDVPAGSKSSRKQMLIDRWIYLKRLESPASVQGKRHMAQLSGSTPIVKGVTIDLLENRIAMLTDLKSCVSQMTRELLEIMYAVRRPSAVKVIPLEPQ